MLYQLSYLPADGTRTLGVSGVNGKRNGDVVGDFPGGLDTKAETFRIRPHFRAVTSRRKSKESAVHSGDRGFEIGW